MINTVSDYSMYSTKYQASLMGLMIFELKSLIGRLLLPKEPPQVKSASRFLHLGCGSRIFEDWVNADFFRPKFWKAPKSLWMLDLRYPLQCDDDYWDGVFCQHVLEHLYPIDVYNLLTELLRTLKPACYLRICVPDLSKYVDYYLGKPSPKEFSKWPTGAEAIRALTQNWGHCSVWDSELLALTLRRVGFVNVKEMEFGKGTDERLVREDEERKYESLYMEAQKPPYGYHNASMD